MFFHPELAPFQLSISFDSSNRHRRKTLRTRTGLTPATSGLNRGLFGWWLPGFVVRIRFHPAVYASREVSGLSQSHREAVLRDSRGLGGPVDVAQVVFACKRDNRLTTWSDVACLFPIDLVRW